MIYEIKTTNAVYRNSDEGLYLCISSRNNYFHKIEKVFINTGSSVLDENYV